jgi:hypothetical protein
MLDGGRVGLLLGAAPQSTAVTDTSNPSPNGSFGFVGTFAKVDVDPESLPTTLVLRYDPQKLGFVGERSLRVFRWEDQAERFNLVIDGGVNVSSDYVWGRITQPGTYAIIGLSQHPLIYNTIDMRCVFDGLFGGAGSDILRELDSRLCPLIYCLGQDGGFDERAINELIEARYPDDYEIPGRGGGIGGRAPIRYPVGPCDMCFRTIRPNLPECELIPRFPNPLDDKLDLVIVLDDSGSAHTFFGRYKEATAQVIEDSSAIPRDGSARVWVVAFATDAIVSVGPEDILDESDAADVASQIRAIPSLGGLSKLHRGLEEAEAELLMNGRINSYKAIIAASDGGYTDVDRIAARHAAEVAYRTVADEIDALAVRGRFGSNPTAFELIVQPQPDTPGDAGFILEPSGDNVADIRAALRSSVIAIRGRS